MEQNTSGKCDSSEAPAVAQEFSHAVTLRALGQVLENHRCSKFEIKVENNEYVITGKVPPPELPKPSLLSLVYGLFSKPPAAIPEKNQTDEIELRYPHGDIRALESQERSRRKVSPEGPDAHSTSQLLRGIGYYLDKRADSMLVSVAVEDSWVTIVSRSRDGQLQKTHQGIEYFYNFWVKMYLHRSDRQSDSTVSVGR
jgi:hypothetical protein